MFYNKIKNEWTHTGVKITDIRKLKRLYMLRLDIGQAEQPVVLIKEEIFNERMESYFIKKIDNISRDEIMALTLDVYLTRGYFVKLSQKTNKLEICKKIDGNDDKWYISFFEVPGNLISFNNIINKHD